MKKFFILWMTILSTSVFAEAHCTNSRINDCPWQYHARCDHVECIKHKCKCHVWGDEDYMGRNYHPPLF